MGPEAESPTETALSQPAGYPFRGPGVLTRVAPFAAVAVLAEASLALSPGPQSAPATIVSIVLLLTVAVAFLLPWPRLPAWASVFVPLLYTGSVLALILAAGTTSGVGIVILVPLVWTALFQRRWESGCVVAAIVIVEVIISLTPMAAADSVIARRVLLWGSLGVLVSVATHDLRDRISRSQGDREALQERLRELSIMEDRDRIAAELRDKVIQRIFAAGLGLQAAMGLSTEAEVRRRVETSVDELDHVTRMLRDAVFDLERRRQRGGLRQEVLRVCAGLSPVPEISFSGQAEEGLYPEDQARLLGLLRETFGLIEPDATPRRVEITAGDASCWVVIDATSRGPRADEDAAEQDFSGLLDQAAQARVRMDVESAPGGIRFSWEFPLSSSVSPATADVDYDRSSG